MRVLMVCYTVLHTVCTKNGTAGRGYKVIRIRSVFDVAGGTGCRDPLPTHVRFT